MPTHTLQWQSQGPHHGDIVAADTGKTLARYHWDPAGSHPYFHPLHSRDSYQPLTNHAPFDHRWHYGLWWSWKLINGIVFWENADPPKEGTNRVVEHAAEAQADGTVRIVEQLEMRPNASGELWMTEQRTLTARPTVPGATKGGLAHAWALDWDATHTAQVRCELDVTPWPDVKWGGYMGLAFRPTRTMGWGEQIRNSAGAEGTEACHGATANWCAYAGQLDGNPHRLPHEPPVAGVAILDHPDNPRHPSPFYAWSTGENNRGFGFLAASPLMHGKLVLEAGQSLRTRYRVVCFDGPIDPAALDAAWQAFADTAVTAG